MSMHDTWIAVQGCTKAELRDLLDLEETDEPRTRHRSSPYFSYGELAGGWAVIWVEVDGWVTWQNLIDASRLGSALALRRQDQVANISVLAGAQDGRIMWEVSAIGDNLTIVGATPPELEPIRERLTSDSALADDALAFHAIPSDLAEALCGVALDEDHAGFRYLRPKAGSDWERPSARSTMSFGSREEEIPEPKTFASTLGTIIVRLTVIMFLLLMILAFSIRLALRV